MLIYWGNNIALLVYCVLFLRERKTKTETERDGGGGTLDFDRKSGHSPPNILSRVKRRETTV